MGAVNTRLVPCYDDSISHSSEERYNPSNRQEFAYDSLVMSASAPASLSSIPRAPSDGKAPSDTPHFPHSSAASQFHRGLSMPTQPAPLQVPNPRHPPSAVSSKRAESPEPAGTPPGAPPPISNIVPQQRVGAAVVSDERQPRNGDAPVGTGSRAEKRPSAEIESSARSNSNSQMNSGDIPTALAEKAQHEEVGMGKRVASMDVPVATPLLVSEPPCTGEMVKPLKSAMKRCGGTCKPTRAKKGFCKQLDDYLSLSLTQSRPILVLTLFPGFA